MHLLTITVAMGQNVEVATRRQSFRRVSVCDDLFYDFIRFLCDNSASQSWANPK
jgi:hypothetical protein